MLRKKLLSIVFLSGLLFSITTTAQAQSSYKTAMGLGIDFGTGSTLVGPNVKHFFSEKDAGQFDILFGNGNTLLEAFYLYHGQFPNAAGLKWYLGAGPGVNLYKGGSNFLLRPAVGLDYKINDVPLNFSFDWKPWLIFGNGGSHFEPARFGLNFRYAF